MSMVCQHAYKHTYIPCCCARETHHLWSMHSVLTGQARYSHTTHREMKKQVSQTKEMINANGQINFPPFLQTHTQTHTHTQWPVLPPNTTTPQIQRLVTFPSHWSLMENWSSTCWRASAPAFIRDHGLDSALQHLDPSTVSWMWNYFACEIARLKCGIKKTQTKQNKKKSLNFTHPSKKNKKPTTQ